MPAGSQRSRPRSARFSVPCGKPEAGIRIGHCSPRSPIRGADSVALEGPTNVLRCLARYARRCPLAEDQIPAADGSRVRFRYRDHRTGRTTTCTLAPDEFLRRLLQHAPPWGFHRVRYYGFLAPGARRTLRSLQLALRRGMAALAPAIARLREPSERRRPLACERCGGTRLRHFDFRAPRRVRAPPVLGAA